MTSIKKYVLMSNEFLKIVEDKKMEKFKPELNDFNKKLCFNEL